MKKENEEMMVNFITLDDRRPPRASDMVDTYSIMLLNITREFLLSPMLFHIEKVRWAILNRNCCFK